LAQAALLFIRRCETLNEKPGSRIMVLQGRTTTMKKILLTAAAASLAVPAAPALAVELAAPVAATADAATADAYTANLDDRKRWKRNKHHRDDRRYYQSGNGVRYWQGDDGRYYCKRSNGTTGLIIGAAGGALLGREIDTRGERATGTILGAAAGALLGREIQRGRVSCR
jgi:hypothetical protein